jgi:hypothetical protein
LDTRNHLKLGYDYPQTYAARTQGGDLAQNLTAWANQELGWVFPGNQNPGASKIDLAHFETQITTRVSCFPDQILVDGTSPLDPNDQYISSAAASAPASAPGTATATAVSEVKTSSLPLMQKKVVTTPANKDPSGTASGANIQPKETASVAASTVSKVASNAASKVSEAVQRVLPKAVGGVSKAPVVGHAPVTIPTHRPTFEQRFGKLGNLVKDGKMTQWNVSYGVDK